MLFVWDGLKSFNAWYLFAYMEAWKLVPLSSLSGQWRVMSTFKVWFISLLLDSCFRMRQIALQTTHCIDYISTDYKWSPGHKHYPWWIQSFLFFPSSAPCTSAKRSLTIFSKLVIIKHAVRVVDNKQILEKENWDQNLEWDLGDCTELLYTDFYFFPLASTSLMSAESQINC